MTPQGLGDQCLYQNVANTQLPAAQVSTKPAPACCTIHHCTTDRPVPSNSNIVGKKIQICKSFFNQYSENPPEKFFAIYIAKKPNSNQQQKQ
jgi:hypothetical protein